MVSGLPTGSELVRFIDRDHFDDVLRQVWHNHDPEGSPVQIVAGCKPGRLAFPQPGIDHPAISKRRRDIKLRNLTLHHSFSGVPRKGKVGRRIPSKSPQNAGLTPKVRRFWHGNNSFFQSDRYSASRFLPRLGLLTVWNVAFTVRLGNMNLIIYQFYPIAATRRPKDFCAS